MLHVLEKMLMYDFSPQAHLSPFGLCHVVDFIVALKSILGVLRSRRIWQYYLHNVTILPLESPGHS